MQSTRASLNLNKTSMYETAAALKIEHDFTGRHFHHLFIIFSDRRYFSRFPYLLIVSIFEKMPEIDPRPYIWLFEGVIFDFFFSITEYRSSIIDYLRQDRKIVFFSPNVFGRWIESSIHTMIQELLVLECPYSRQHLLQSCPLFEFVHSVAIYGRNLGLELLMV